MSDPTSPFSLQRRLEADLRTITAEIERLTGIPSSWNGRVEIIPANNREVGGKTFSCLIRVEERSAVLREQAQNHPYGETQVFAGAGGNGNGYCMERASKMDDNYADSRAFVKKMRALSRKRDLNSIQQAVQQMQDWLLAHPYDIHVGTALEEFSILEEAAHIIEARKAQSAPPQSDSVVKAS